MQKIFLWSKDQKQALQRTVLPKCLSEDVSATILTSDSVPEVADGLIFAMGSKPLSALAEASLVPKNRTITSLRYPKVFSYPNGCELLVSYSAALIDIDYSKYVDLMLDLNVAIRRVKTGTYSPVIGKYEYVDLTEESLVAIYTDIGDQYDGVTPVEISLDTETVGFDPLAGWIVSIQVAYKPGFAKVMYLGSKADSARLLKRGGPVRRFLKHLLSSEHFSIRAANGKFDMNWIYHHTGIQCTNFKFDTMLVGSLLDENRGNSLNLHTKWYVPELGGYDDDFNNTQDKSAMQNVPKAKFLTYAGGDADACLRVSKKQRAELLRDKKLTRFYVNVLHPAARAYEKVERVGILVDTDYYRALETDIKMEIANLHTEAIKEIGGRIVAKHSDNLNLSKPALIKDFMFSPMGLNLKPKMLTKKTKEPSTSMDHLKMFEDHPKAQQFVGILKEYGSAQKTLSTYICKRDDDGAIIGGFLSHLRSDGRFHPAYFLFNGGDDEGGTNTGRLSVRDPAIQTIPKHTKWAKLLRKAFIAPPGHLILANDYSQGELKIAACLSNESNMLAAYLRGVDLHSVTAAALLGVSLEDFMHMREVDPERFELQRFLGKAGNFGLIYGMGAQGFQIYALMTYGVRMSLDEAEEYRSAFFRRYPGLLPWHKKSKETAKKYKYIRSPLGRVRHLPLIASMDREVAAKAERQAVNAPVQGTLSDMSLWSTAEFDRRGWMEESPVIAMIHDQLISYVPEDKWEECARRNKEVMENLPFNKLGWNPQLQFTVDCEVGMNLGDLRKVAL